MGLQKKTIPAMLPQKVWLSRAEAMAYLDMGVDLFTTVAIEKKLSVRELGKKTYYNVNQINRVLEEAVLIK